MKVAILAGGRGTRLSQANVVRPKPVVEIGGRPIMVHVMEMFASFGHRDFYVALGYHCELIRKYFLKYHGLPTGLTLDRAAEMVEVRDPQESDWRVQLVDTGQHTQTGGRVKQLISRIGGETFFVTYSDGVADLNLNELIRFHRSHGRLATVTAVRPPARRGPRDRFGALSIAENGEVTRFAEKAPYETWINGGFFVFEPAVRDYIEGDDVVLEKETMQQLSANAQLMAYRHKGFWQCMDTLSELEYLDGLSNEGFAPWRRSKGTPQNHSC